MSEKQPILSSVPVLSQPMHTGVAEFGQVQGNLVCSLDGHREWASGLCACSEDPTNCLMVAFCTPCVLCQLSTRMGEWVCMPFCVPAATVTLRARLRTLGGIQGTICNDYLTLLCCGHCALCQMKREMDVMGLV